MKNMKLLEENIEEIGCWDTEIGQLAFGQDLKAHTKEK